MKMLRVALTASGALVLAVCGPGEGPRWKKRLKKSTM